MSIFKFNKKLYTITLMLIFMIIIILISNLFENKIKNVALSNNNIDGFINYKISSDKVYSISLPNGWRISETVKNNDKFYLKINGLEDILCEVEIIDGDLEKNILNQKKYYSIKNENDWKVLEVNNYNNVEKFYIKDYSEGKILILKFSYNKNKQKDSIDIVFDIIANSFK